MLQHGGMRARSFISMSGTSQPFSPEIFLSHHLESTSSLEQQGPSVAEIKSRVASFGELTSWN